MIDNNELIHQTWPEWKVQKKLGEGSYGSVYLAEREDMLGKVQTAIKVVSIPKDTSTMDALRAEQMDDASIHTYLENQVKMLGAEIRLMETVKGYTNIVSIEDYRLISQPEIPRWHVLIRMELLKPLLTHMAERQMTVDDVIKLGSNICTALTVCRQKNIIHRDIKPENIFINQNGDYKLGDFGVARTLEGKTDRMTRIGTAEYMAPEVFNGIGGKVDIDEAAGSDIYSLGIVMYKILNNGRIPFLPTGNTFSPSDRDSALLERMHGSALPPPLNGDDHINRVILKACAFKPADRYASAEEMRFDLLNITPAPPSPPPPKPPIVKIIAGVGAVLAIGAGVWWFTRTAPLQQPEVTVEESSGGSVTVRWDEQKSVSQYARELWLPNGNRRTENVTDTREWVIPVSDLAGGKYTVRIGAIPKGGTEDDALWGGETFELAATPTPPPSIHTPNVTLTGVEDGPNGLPILIDALTVTWDTQENATEYAAQLVLPDETILEGPHSNWNTQWRITADDLPKGIEGFCTVEVRVFGPDKVESEPGSARFEVAVPPPMPTVTLEDATAESDGLPLAENGATLTWSAHEGVTAWSIALEKADGTFEEYGTTEDTQWHIPEEDLSKEGIYTAHVVALSHGGAIQSEPGSVRFKVAPEAAELRLDLALESREDVMIVTWEEQEGVEYYRLRLSLPDGTLEDQGTTLSSRWEIPVQALPVGVSRAEVVAVGPENRELGADSIELLIGNIPPHAPEIRNVDADANGEVTLEWDAQPGVEAYALELETPVGRRQSFGTTPDTTWVLTLEALTNDGPYTAYVGAIRTGDDVSDALWGDVSFNVARPKALTISGSQPVAGEAVSFSGGTIEISWDRQDDAEKYLFALNRPDGTRSNEGSTRWNNKWSFSADDKPLGSYQALVGMVPEGGDEADAQWSSIDFRIVPGPIGEVDLPAVTIPEQDYREDGVDYVTGDSIRVSWQTQENAERYVVTLTGPDGVVESIEGARSDGVEIDLTDRPAGIYTVSVCAIPKNGQEPDGKWGDAQFGLPEKPAFEWEKLSVAPEVQTALANFLDVEPGEPVDEAQLSRARYCTITSRGIAFHNTASQWKRALQDQSTDLLIMESALDPIITALNTTGLSVEGLALSGISLEDASPLSGMGGLKALWLENTDLHNIEPLAALDELDQLNLSNNEIEDVTPLKQLTGLKQLDLSKNNLSNIDALGELTSLTSLDLSDNDIDDIASLSSLTSLGQLMLQGNRIKDIGALSGMNRLTLLMLNNNRIREIKPLAQLDRLNFLWLSNNEIEDLTPLSGLKSLDTLYLDGNRITDVSALSGLTQLKRLYLYGNAIEDVTPVAHVQTVYN